MFPVSMNSSVIFLKTFTKAMYSVISWMHMVISLKLELFDRTLPLKYIKIESKMTWALSK